MNTYTWIIAGFLTVDTAAIAGAAALIAAIARNPVLAISSFGAAVLPSAAEITGYGSSMSALLDSACSTPRFDVPED